MLGNLDTGRIKEQQDEVKVLHYVSTLTEDKQCRCQAIKWQNGFITTTTVSHKTN